MRTAVKNGPKKKEKNTDMQNTYYSNKKKEKKETDFE